MQPNSYYGFGMTPLQQSQSQPQAPAQPSVKPAKKHNGLTPVVILLLLVCLGLGAYILIDKFVLKKAPEVIVEQSSTSISESLSKLKLPESGEARDQELAKALAGRIFIADAAHEQTLKFDNNVEYTFDYYKDPASDIRKVLPSTAHGNYTVSNNVISLQSGDRFTVTDDYLIKTDDNFSHNLNVVYFDAQQMKTAYTSINNAFDTYITNQAKVNKGSIAADRTYIDFSTIVCKIGDSRLTNADNYYCSTDYTLYVTKDTADKAIADSQKQEEPKADENKEEKKDENKDEKKEEKIVYKNFIDYCEKNLNKAEFTKGGTCKEDYSIRANANIIVRITDGEYRITGLFR